ncbi:MAG TPA: DUF6352 family protein [Usitatibacter sp.]|nr:DUF6352 family protein [Usitatibacter sp.]
MPQDFWASSGYHELEKLPAGLRATPEWLARFLTRDELLPPPESGPHEQLLHARLAGDPLAALDEAALAPVEDSDARDNWREFGRFRDRVLAFPTLEAAYRDLFRRPEVDLAPPFVDAIVHAIVRGLLGADADAWLCRAGEMLFRRQRLATEAGQVLVADAATLEAFHDTGGFGNVGRLLRRQSTELPAVKMDVLDAENASFYFMRDELYSFALDITPGRDGANAIARVLERWVGRMAGVRVAIEPVARVEDARWRWHAGLDIDSSAILDALYRGEKPGEEEIARLALLFELRFENDADATPGMRGKPVYLGLACRPDRTLKVKPQNLLVNLPLARDANAERVE